jgi:hypothetical protein
VENLGAGRRACRRIRERKSKKSRDRPSAPLREKAEPPTAVSCGAANPSAQETEKKIETQHEGGGASGEHASSERKIAIQDFSHSGGSGATRETTRVPTLARFHEWKIGRAFMRERSKKPNVPRTRNQNRGVSSDPNRKDMEKNQTQIWHQHKTRCKLELFH